MASSFQYADPGMVAQDGSKSGAKAAHFAKQRHERAAQYEAKRAELQQRTTDAAMSMLGPELETEVVEAETAAPAGTRYGVETKEHREAARRAAFEAQSRHSMGLAPIAATAADGLAPDSSPEAAEGAAASDSGAVTGPASARSVKRPPKRARVAVSFTEDDDDEEEEEEDGGASVGAFGRSSRRRQPAVAPAAASSAAATAGHPGSAPGPSSAAAATAAASKRPRFEKDPTANTWFLATPHTEASLEEARRQLAAEWEASQEAIKKQKIEVTFSYWDGSGHRRRMMVPKGATISKFLDWVREDLLKDFPEMRGTTSGDLLFVKEDLIIPGTVSFYDLIASKARGKSGPLFSFAALDEVRVVDDARVEREDSHPGKVVQRHWYEKNKHVFPASRWEVYDPTVDYAERYRVKG